MSLQLALEEFRVLYPSPGPNALANFLYWCCYLDPRCSPLPLVLKFPALLSFKMILDVVFLVGVQHSLQLASTISTASKWQHANRGNRNVAEAEARREEWAVDGTRVG